MISIIICSRDDRRFEAVARSYAAAMRDEPFDILRVSNARSLAKGYNIGLAKAAGDIVIFSHDDIEILSPRLDYKIRELLTIYDIVGVAGTSRLINPKWTSAGPPYLFGQIVHPRPDNQFAVNIYGAPRRHIGNIQAVDGVFIAARRSVLDKIQFDESFDGFHLYDIDFTFRAHQAGLKLAVSCEIQLLHQSTGKFDESWTRYADIFTRKHRAHLPQFPPREMAWAGVIVSSKSETLEIMNPPYWNST